MANDITVVSNTTKYAIGALIVVSIFLGFMLLRGCSDISGVKAERDKLKQMNDSVIQREGDANKIIVAQTKKIDTIELSRAKVIQESTVLQTKLNLSENNASSLSKEVKKYKTTRDTVAYYVACDSLSDVVDSVVAVEQSDRSKISTIQSSFNQELLSKDTIINQKTKLYSDLRNSWSDVLKDYNNTLVDYNKLQKRYKRERTLTRIVAGVGIILVGAVIAK